MIIKYDLIGAAMAGVKMHPQKYIEMIGGQVEKYEGVPIADCAMMQLKEKLKSIPTFVEVKEDYSFI